MAGEERDVQAGVTTLRVREAGAAPGEPVAHLAEMLQELLTCRAPARGGKGDAT